MFPKTKNSRSTCQNHYSQWLPPFSFKDTSSLFFFFSCEASILALFTWHKCNRYRYFSLPLSPKDTAIKLMNRRRWKMKHIPFWASDESCSFQHLILLNPKKYLSKNSLSNPFFFGTHVLYSFISRILWLFDRIFFRGPFEIFLLDRIWFDSIPSWWNLRRKRTSDRIINGRNWRSQYFFVCEDEVIERTWAWHGGPSFEAR